MMLLVRFPSFGAGSPDPQQPSKQERVGQTRNRGHVRASYGW